MTALLSILGGIFLFSILLFIVSLNIAKQIILPIEALAEKERAYARHIAHELKTPLAVMKSDLEIIKSIPSETMTRIDSAIDEITAMQSSVDDLLRLSIGETGLTKKKIDDQKVIRELIEEFGNGIDWKIPKEKGILHTEADPGLFKTLIKNLIENIRSHALGNTPATVTFHKHGFVFENSAEHIPENIAKIIFDPFIGTPGKGSGIGLSIVKKIVDLHGWNISFESKENKVRIEVTF